MASKTGIFSYGQKKRKIGHSNLNMGYNSLTTDNLGQLKVKACLETLADDYWHIGHNTLTKAKPMVSPAFTRIHQNWYAFYCSNHKVWEHWDDYITNGTEYGRVYGSNFTNQKLDNPWKIPQVMAPDLMIPLKLAHGFAVPIHRVILNHHRWNLLFPFFTQTRRNAALHNFNPATSDYDLFNNNRITDFVALLLPLSNFPNIPYFEAYYIDEERVLFEYTLDEPDNYVFLKQLDLTLPQQFAPELDAGHDIDPIAGNAEEYLGFTTFRFFSDSASSDVSVANSPFVMTKKISNSYYNSLDLNFFSYSQRRDLDNYYPVYEDNQSSVLHHFVGIDSRFFGKRYFVSYQGSASDLTFYNFDYLPGDSAKGWSVNMKDLYGLTSGQKTPQEIYDIMHVIPGYLGVTTKFWDDMLDNRALFNLSPSILSASESVVNPYNDLFLQTDIYQHGSSTCFHSTFADFNSDIVLPLNVDSNFIQAPIKYAALWPPQSNMCDSLGYYSISWMIYLCKQTSILLDDFGLPIDALTVRNTFDYRYETFNSLPFFAYSNIWEYHFRNQVVSSPELDYRKTNGFMLLTESRRHALSQDFHRPSQLPEIWTGVDFMNSDSEGWVIPFSYLPKNSQAKQYTSISTSDASYRHFVDGKNHYFNVNNYIDVFSILTGASLDLIVLHQTYRNYINHFNMAGGLDYRTFASLYQNDFYLPSYYNGLLHLKYQNFNKDYFTSAMLDPMSGANQVELGDTINELRVNEAKQSWFEKIVKNRSVVKFMESIFGITPLREEKEAVLLGSDHVDINIGEVIQTSQTDQTPQGTRSGLGSAKEDGKLVDSHCNEHGFILILCSHTLESQYFQGIARHWLPKASYMDYPTVDFAHVGNESILQKEINYGIQPTKEFRQYQIMTPDLLVEPSDTRSDLSVMERNFNGRQKYQGTGNPNMFHFINNQAGIYQRIRNQAKTAGTSLDNVWGYTPRWSYYKFNLDQLHGEMRTKLQDWHTFRKFYSQPILSHEFVNWELTADSDELNRIFAVTDDFIEDKFLLDIFINATVNRAIDYVCVPMSK